MLISADAAQEPPLVVVHVAQQAAPSALTQLAQSASDISHAPTFAPTAMAPHQEAVSPLFRAVSLTSPRLALPCPALPHSVFLLHVKRPLKYRQYMGIWDKAPEQSKWADSRDLTNVTRPDTI